MSKKTSRTVAAILRPYISKCKTTERNPDGLLDGMYEKDKIMSFVRLAAWVASMASCYIFVNWTILDIPFPKWLSYVFQFPIYEDIHGWRYKRIADGLFAFAFLIPGLLWRVPAGVYLAKLARSLWVFRKPLPQHYLIGIVAGIPISLIFNQQSRFQTAFLFPADFLCGSPLIILLSALYYVICPPAVKDVGFNLITPVDEDRIGFGDIVNQLFEQCMKLNDGDDTVCVGIVGDYGSGKTHLLNLFSAHVRKQRMTNRETEAGKLRMVYMDVARYPSAAVLYVQLYDSILSVVEREFVVPLQMRYELVEAVTEAAGSKSLVKFMDAIIPRTNPDKFHDHITQMLSGTGIRLIILLDDIDRLMPSEMDHVVRLIRLLRTTKKVFVLVATDPGQLAVYQGLVAGAKL